MDGSITLLIFNYVFCFNLLIILVAKNVLIKNSIKFYKPQNDVKKFEIYGLWQKMFDSVHQDKNCLQTLTFLYNYWILRFILRAVKNAKQQLEDSHTK